MLSRHNAFDDYCKYIEKDATLEHAGHHCHTAALKKQYEQHHGLEIQDAALVAAAQLAGRYITRRQFPVIDEAGVGKT
ncbi:hypothetical protein ZWY2020_001251 [Hordeum vulgare]|nr:hypothetical protein ZWY2020_001251 [Hordeum vulgare]